MQYIKKLTTGEIKLHPLDLENQLLMMDKSSIIAFALQHIATIGETIESGQGASPELIQQTFSLAKIMKESIKDAYETHNPTEVTVPYLAIMNDMISSLKDMSLYLKYPDFFQDVAALVTKSLGIPHTEMYSSETATLFIKETLKEMSHSLQKGKPFSLPQFVGNFKSISSQIYSVATEKRPDYFLKKGEHAVSFSHDAFEKIAHKWEENRPETLSVIAEALPFVEDRIRTRIFFDSTQDFDAFVVPLRKAIKKQSLFNKLKRVLSPRLQDWYAAFPKIYTFISHYPQGENVGFDIYPTDKEQPSTQILSLLEQELEKDQITYAAVHAYYIFNEVPVEIIPVLGRIGLRGLYNAGAVIRRFIGEGNTVPNYSDMFKDPGDIIEAAREELEILRNGKSTDEEEQPAFEFAMA
jgi:hypothetical protein